MTGPAIPVLPDNMVAVKCQKALVIGGCGYLGRRLVEMLIARGQYDNITVMDMVKPNATAFSDDVSETHAGQGACLSSGLPKPSLCPWFYEVANGRSLSKATRVFYVQGDVCRLVDIINAISTCANEGNAGTTAAAHSSHSENGPITIFHLASPSLSADTELLYQVNVLGTKNVLEACRVCGIRQLVFCSSCSVVFGNKPIRGGTEALKYAFKQFDPYSETKALAEMSVKEANGSPLDSRVGGGVLRTICVRPHMIFGPGDPYCITGIIQRLKQGKSKVIIGDGSTLVDPTYVDNVCWGHILAAEALSRSEELGGTVFNITNDEAVKFWDFFSCLCGAFGYPRPMYRVPYLLVWMVVRVMEFFGLRMDLTSRKLDLVALDHTYSCERAKQLLGYRPLVSLRQGLRNVIDHAVLTDKEIMKNVNDIKAKQRSLEKSGSTAGDAVRTNIWWTALLWTSHYVWLLVSIVAFAKSGGLVAAYLSSFFFGLKLLDYHSKFRILVTSTLSLWTWALIASAAGMAALVLHIWGTRGTVIGTGKRVPMIGDILDSGGAPTTMCIKRARESFDCFSISFLGLPVVFVTGQDGYEFFFKATDEEVSLNEVYKFTRALFGEKVIYDGDLEARREQFHFMSQALSENSLEKYADLIVKECEQYFSRWGDSGECDNIENELSELITLTACRCLLGKEVRENFQEECKKLIETLDHGVTPLSLIFPFFPIPAHIARDKARMKLQAIFAEIMAGRRSKQNQDPEELDMLGLLMNAKLKDGHSFSDSQICGLLTTLIFAGQHTSSVTITWLLINLLSRTTPDVVELLIQEQEGLQKSGGLTFENMSKQTNVLGSCLIESLRLCNPLAVLLRYCSKSRYFKGHVFGAGTILAVCTNEAGGNPDIFENPDAFIPNRWIQDDWDDWRQQYKFVGFGAGKHTCMGRRFAHLQIKTVMSYLLQNFSMKSLSIGYPSRNEKAMVIGPDRAFKISYRRIHGDLQKLRSGWNHTTV